MWSLFRTPWDLDRLMAATPKPEPSTTKAQSNPTATELQVKPVTKPQYIHTTNTH